MAKFQDKILGWSAKAKQNGTQVSRQLARIGLRAVVKRSPVDTGRFRGNWRVGIGAADLTFKENLKDKVGDYTLSRGFTIINRAGWGERIFVTNITPYGIYLEGGSSPQATPGGIVAVTLADLRAAAPREIVDVRRKNVA